MQLRAEQLEAHLARTLAPLYCIHGDEPLLALEAADAVRAAARRRGFDERQVLQAERNFDWSELKHALASQSLFGARKLIELRLPGGKPGVPGAEAIASMCRAAARHSGEEGDLLFLVSLPRLDKATQSAAWFAALSACGMVVDVHPVDRARLPAWIGERLARQQQRAAREVLQFLADRVEGNLLAAHQEIQKLAFLAPAGDLSLEAVRNAVVQVARYDAYDASEALLQGDLARFVRVVDGLRGEGEAPSLLLWVISEDLRALAVLHSAAASGQPAESLYRELRLWGARQASIRNALRRLARARVEQALLRAAKIDRAIKGLARRDPWDELIALGRALG